MSAPQLTPDEVLALPAVVPVWPTLGQIYGISKNTTYQLAARDELPVPVRRVGRQYRARRVDLLVDLGLTEPEPDNP